MKAEALTAKSGLTVQGPLLITPQVFSDGRGFFFESWNGKDFNAILNSFGQASVEFVQDNHSRSSLGVLRGLHFQKNPFAQSKLLRCVRGQIFDVVVDCRLGSATFGQSVAVNLSSESFLQLWVPAGFAHGFLTLSDDAEILYKATGYWVRESERSLLWNDPRLSIPWPIDAEPKLSEKDSLGLTLRELTENGDLYP